MIDNLKAWIKETIKRNLKGYVLIAGIFLAGVLLSLLLNISSSYEEEIKLYINDFISNVKGYSIDSVKTFRLAMYGYIKTIALFLTMSLCILGNYAILVYTFIKGFSYGAVFCALINTLEAKTALSFLCIVLLHTIISFPCILFYMLFCFKSSCALVSCDKKTKNSMFLSFILAFFTLGVLCISALVQAYIEPLLIRISSL